MVSVVIFWVNSIAFVIPAPCIWVDHDDVVEGTECVVAKASGKLLGIAATAMEGKVNGTLFCLTCFGNVEPSLRSVLEVFVSPPLFICDVWEELLLWETGEGSIRWVFPSESIRVKSQTVRVPEILVECIYHDEMRIHVEFVGRVSDVKIDIAGVEVIESLLDGLLVVWWHCWIFGTRNDVDSSVWQVRDRVDLICCC